MNRTHPLLFCFLKPAEKESLRQPTDPVVPQTPSQGCHSLVLAPQPCSGHPLTHTSPVLRLLVPTAMDGGRGRRGHRGRSTVRFCGAQHTPVRFGGPSASGTVIR